ncbi:hypothetical protein [Rhodanobacter sp. DHB23]|uniref:hypothetical protein n=1 Tax=Rhodanobacter sp. DHB23 TaxID=2775923 RepID=UPI001785504E|nr:hypothetical protein [Rhodanobacter sp. DHB23]MBD8873129.1 hypothetical protein [Rhodanobacter sp. DHB23]
MPTVYVILAAATLFITSAARYISLRRVVTRLKQINMSKWVEMGSPEPTFFSRFSDYTTWQPTNLRAPDALHTELSMWLTERDYERLHDVEITLNANRYRLLGNLQLAISLIFVCAFLYFRFVQRPT